MKSLLKIFGVLFMLLFQLTGCLDKNDQQPVYYFYDEPVAVHQKDEYPVVRNEDYLFYVPELVENTTLKDRDLLWTSFTVDLEDQAPNIYYGAHAYTARRFRYQTVDSSKVIIPADVAEFESYMQDDYSAPIELAVLYRYKIDNLWFFGFKQRDQSNQLSHTYELILNPEIEDDGNNYPTLYIRSKQINAEEAQGGAKSRDGNIFAFDVSDFARYSSNGQVRFNLKYKTGVDSDGKDIYKAFMSNPIQWNFNLENPE